MKKTAIMSFPECDPDPRNSDARASSEGDDICAHLKSLKVSAAPVIDGDLTKECWAQASWPHRFVDMVTGEPAFFDTRLASLWDDECLYLGYRLEEPSVRAAYTERDSLVWFDKDGELFIDGEDCYYELEINALNTVYEVFFIYQRALGPGSRFYGRPEFDLYSRNVDVLCGFQDGARYGRTEKRWAFMDWDFPGLRSAVKIDGALNDPRTVSRGWSVEIALPWEGLRVLAPSKRFPPRGGDSLRAAFFRFEALSYHGKTAAEHPGWALNAHGVYDSHLPEKFSFVDFTE